MKFLKPLLFIITLFTSLGTQAQQIDTTWLRQYDRVSQYSKANIATVNANKYIVQYGERYYEINGAGDSLTSGMFDTTLGGPRSFTSDGTNHYAGGWSAGGPSIAKLDANYNIVWNTALNQVSFGQGVDAIFLDSNYIYVSGSYSSSRPFIAKLDSAGNIIWNKSFAQTSFSSLTDIIKLQDGSYLACGNRDDYPLAFKFNSLGDTAWSYTENMFISFTYAAAAEKANGNTVMVMRNTVIELDPAGTRVDSNRGINDYYDIFREGDTLYLFGIDYEQQFSSEKYAFVETRNLALDSTNAWRKTWDSHPFADNGFNSVVRTTTGGFIAAGKHRDSINVIANTYNILVARFNDSVSNTNTSVYEISKQLEANQFYPNPATNQITLELTNIEEVTLSNILGTKITVKKVRNVMDVSTVPSGMYIINVQADGIWYNSKVLIQH